MQFLYVFSLMFLSIFGLTMLIKLAAWALLSRSSCRHDVYVRAGEDLDCLVEQVRRCPHIGRVVIVSSGNEWDEEAQTLSRKYKDVVFVRSER